MSEKRMKKIYLIITIVIIIIILASLITGLIKNSDTNLIDIYNSEEIFNNENKTKDNDTEKKLIFRDDFNNISLNWKWDTKLTSYSVNDGIAKLIVPRAFRFWYFNAEMYNKDLPYLYKNMKVRVRVEPITKGSKGWGFWNGQFKISECHFAWFIYLKSSLFYPKNGLYVHCMGGNLKDMTYIPIEGFNIEDWHNYEIIWTEEYVDFYIDNTLVGHVTKGVPQTKCRADIWIDNAVWLPVNTKKIFTRQYFSPIFNRILFETKLYLDYIEIFE